MRSFIEPNSSTSWKPGGDKSIAAEDVLGAWSAEEEVIYLDVNSLDQSSAIWKSENVATALLFLVVVFLLTLGTIVNCLNSDNRIAEAERRFKASCPEFRFDGQSLLHYPIAFSGFFNDRFACRQELIELLNYFAYKVFAVSNNPQVVVGRHGWLFFFDGGDDETTRHYPLLSQEQLEKWGHALEARRAWLAARHCKFLFVIAPSKCSIYGEELPRAFRPIVSGSQQDQLLGYLKLNSKVKVVDLRQVLLNAKKFVRLYYLTDLTGRTLVPTSPTQKLRTILKIGFQASSRLS
jgi:hypothetical protein